MNRRNFLGSMVILLGGAPMALKAIQAEDKEERLRLSAELNYNNLFLHMGVPHEFRFDFVKVPSTLNLRYMEIFMHYIGGSEPHKYRHDFAPVTLLPENSMFVLYTLTPENMGVMVQSVKMKIYG